MRVLTVGNMYPPHHQGGYELIWRSWVEHMRAAGHEVRVLTTDHREPDPDGALADDPAARRELRWYWRDHEFPPTTLRDRLALERHNKTVLERHLGELRAQAIVWWALGGMSLSSLEHARRARVPAVGVVVDEWMAYAPLVDGWQASLARPLLGRAAELLTGVPTGFEIAPAARWIFVSEYLRARAVAAGIDVVGADVVHAGIDPDLFAAAAARKWEGRLLCLGRIDPRKGLETAIRALSRLPRASLRFVGGGDPEHLSRLRALADELGVKGRVSFEKLPRDQIARAYAEADALLFCVSWPEPFGLVPLEAMSVGTPVIATGTGGSGEYLDHEANCLLVRPDDPEGLATAVVRLEGEPELRERLRAAGRDTAAAHGERRFNEAVRVATEQAAEASR